MRKVKENAMAGRILFLRGAAILAPVAIALLLSLTVFAQTTYVITDGSRVMVHTTSATNPKTVLGEAGLELGTNDTYTTQDGSGTAQIHIQRGQIVYVNYYGEQMEVLSTGETVEQLLTRWDLLPGEGDAVSVPLNTEIYDGMKLTVGHVIRQNQTYTTVLPHETIRCSDAALPEGEQKVLTEGEDGQMLCEAVVTYLNGVETGRKVLNRQVISQPVSEIIAVGTGAQQEEAEKPHRRHHRREHV